MRLLRTVVVVLLLWVPLGAFLAACSTTPAAEHRRSAAGIVAGDVDDFSFASMAADYALSRAEDGSSRLTVVETFVAVFPDSDQNHGMRRVFSAHYNGQPLHPELISVTDGDGNARPAETDSDDGDFVITSRSDDFLHGAQTFVFTYTLENVTYTFPDTGDDEFYWDVNGVGWAQPFGQVSATVHVDPTLVSALTGQASCYRGVQGATDQCDITDDGGTITASATGFGPYETMTVAVGFTKGTFAAYDTSYFSNGWGWLQAIGGLGVIGAVVAAIVVRRTALTDQGGRPTIIAEYTPPPGIDALESAVLLGVPNKAIPAEVLEQAVRGSIRILESPPRRWGSARLQAQLIDPSRADGDGRMLLGGLYGDRLTPGEVFEFGRSDSRFSGTAQKILKAAEGELARRELRRKVSGWARFLPILAAVVFGGTAVVAGVFALDDDIAPITVIAVIVAAFVAFFVVVGIVSRKPLTAAGSELRDHLAGLKVFIEWAEADRIRMLQSVRGAERTPIANDPRQVLRLYEQLLPYAVVFGQEKEWAKHLVALYGDGTPYWYTGSGPFNAAAFSAGIGTLSASASSSSSTSGGSGGGGSAGGGGGGGGGGGV